QRDLAWRRAMSVGNPLQHLPSLAARRRKFIVTERRIGNNGNAVLPAPWDDRVFDRALFKMIEHLIAGELALTCNVQNFAEIVAIEIADAPGSDFSRALKLLERSDRVCKWIRSAPVKQIAIEP